MVRKANYDRRRNEGENNDFFFYGRSRFRKGFQTQHRSVAGGGPCGLPTVPSPRPPNAEIICRTIRLNGVNTGRVVACGKRANNDRCSKARTLRNRGGGGGGVFISINRPVTFVPLNSETFRKRDLRGEIVRAGVHGAQVVFTVICRTRFRMEKRERE